jgi:hypothetical protein
MGFIDSRQAIDEPFQRTKETICKGTFPFKNTGHVETQRLCAKQNQCKEEKNLKPAIRGHDENFLLELFGAQQRVHQINEQSRCDKAERQYFDHRFASFAPKRSHPIAYPIAIAKNSVLATTQPISHMILPPPNASIRSPRRILIDRRLQLFGHFWRSNAIFPIQTVDA